MPDDETTGQRIIRLRRELGWTQERLHAESGVHVSTISNIERDKPTARGERLSLVAVEAALERGRRERESGDVPASSPTAPDLRLVVAVLESAETLDVRVKSIGPRRAVRLLSVVARDPGVTDQEYAEALWELHRREQEEDRPRDDDGS